MDDYESDSLDGVQPRMIAVPAEEWDRVQAQRDMARAALEAVEWARPSSSVDYPRGYDWCPWCKSSYPGHAPDCQRQAALAAMEVNERVQKQRDNLVSAIRHALAVMPIQNNWTYKDVIDILNAALAAMEEKQQEPEPDICPKCGSDIGHRINCPDGIAFTRTKP